MTHLRSALMALALAAVLHAGGADVWAVPWTWTTLDCPGATETRLLGISGSQIVGSSSSGHFAWDGTRWTHLDLPGTPYGIDGDKIVGVGTGYHGFLSDGTGWTTLDYPDAPRTFATDISGDDVVGYYWDEVRYEDIGFLYDGTTWTSFYFPYGKDTCPFGISNGRIVGQYFHSGMHGFVYDGTAWTTLTYPGAYDTYATDIDGDNIVGYFNNYDLHHTGGYLYDGVTWTPLDYPGATSTQAYGVWGNTIVGCYYDANSVVHGFVLQIPEPAALGMLLLGCFLAPKRAREGAPRPNHC